MARINALATKMIFMVCAHCVPMAEICHGKCDAVFQSCVADPARLASAATAQTARDSNAPARRAFSSREVESFWLLPPTRDWFG
jgi:hypothetical protein